MIKIYEPNVFSLEIEQMDDRAALLDFFENGHLKDYVILYKNGVFYELLDYYSVLFQKTGVLDSVCNSEDAFSNAKTFFKNNANKKSLLPVLNSAGLVISFFQWDDTLSSISENPTFLPEDFRMLSNFDEIVLYNCDEYNWHILRGAAKTQCDKKIILTGQGWDIFEEVSLIRESANILYLDQADIKQKDRLIVICSLANEEILHFAKDRLLNGKILLDSIFQKQKICVFLSDDFEKDKELLNKVQPLTDNIEITAFLTNNIQQSHQEIDGISIHYIQDLQHMVYDKIFICCKIGGDENFIRKINQLLFGYHISLDKIDEFYWGIVKMKLFRRYRCTADKEILELMEYLQQNSGSIWGPYLKGYTPQVWKVFWDEPSGYPYIVFENKRMFFPHDYRNFVISNGQIYICDILLEQHDSSPHLYCKDNVIVENGDIVVDAGVCEGNFALRYIDNISKLYLVECDPLWEEPLKLTFAPYKEKVVFCNKFLTDYNDDTHITLDTLVSGNVDFIKMDIEGEEPKALRGASNLLTDKNLKLSICTYHRTGQYEEIKTILEENGYSTTHSNGFMLFCEDPDFARTADARRGVIRAWKDENIS